MACNPAVMHSRANGQVRHTATMISDQRLLSPMSQNGRSSTRCNWSTRMWLSIPWSRCSRKLQVITAA